MDKTISLPWIDPTIEKIDIPKGKIYDSWRMKVLTLPEFETLTDRKLLYLCQYGILASTSHNSIPQRFKTNPQENKIEVWLDRKFVLEHSDKKGRQACVSIGCAVKNIELAATAYGFKTSLRTLATNLDLVKPYKPTEEQFTLLVEITLEKQQLPFDPSVLESLISRKVVRAEYDDNFVLDQNIKNQMQQIIKNNYPDLELAVYTSKEDLHQIGKFQEDADRTVFEDDGFTYELGHWLIPNQDEKLPYAIRGREFGLDDVFAEKIHKGLLREEPLMPDQIASFARAGRASMESSSAVAIITTNEDTIQDWIDGGRALEELLVFLSKNNLYTSVHAGMTEVEWVKSVFASTVLHLEKKPTCIFRIGVPKREDAKNRPHSARPSLGELIIQ